MTIDTITQLLLDWLTLFFTWMEWTVSWVYAPTDALDMGFCLALAMSFWFMVVCAVVLMVSVVYEAYVLDRLDKRIAGSTWIRQDLVAHTYAGGEVVPSIVRGAAYTLTNEDWEDGCEFSGRGGTHSDEYYDDGACEYCGAKGQEMLFNELEDAHLDPPSATEGYCNDSCSCLAAYDEMVGMGDQPERTDEAIRASYEYEAASHGNWHPGDDDQDYDLDQDPPIYGPHVPSDDEIPF